MVVTVSSEASDVLSPYLINHRSFPWHRPAAAAAAADSNLLLVLRSRGSGVCFNRHHWNNKHRLAGILLNRILLFLFTGAFSQSFVLCIPVTALVHSQLSEGLLVRGLVLGLWLGSSKVIQTAKNSLPQRCSERSWPNPNPNPNNRNLGQMEPRTSEPSDNWAETIAFRIKFVLINVRFGFLELDVRFNCCNNQLPFLQSAPAASYPEETAKQANKIIGVDRNLISMSLRPKYLLVYAFGHTLQWYNVIAFLCPRPYRRGIKRWCCLTSVCRVHRA